MMAEEEEMVQERFWGVAVRARTALRIQLPERCALCLRNACLARGTAATLSLQVEGGAPMLLATLAAAGLPMASLDVDVPAGSTAVLVCDGGDGHVHVIGHTQRTITEEDYQLDEDEVENMPFTQMDDEDDEEEEKEEEEEEEEKPNRKQRRLNKRHGRK